MKDTISIGNSKIALTDYAISGNALLGIRDSGKTVTAKGIAEQLLEAGIPIVVFDAVGKWRWLKTAGTVANSKGFEVVVVGGAGADLPMNVQTIEDIIRASIKQNISLVVDLYDPKLSKSDWRHIVQKSIHIIHYENRGIRHVFLEEAAEYVPQKFNGRDEAIVYGEVEKMVRMGGNASVGITLISQRTQEVNKAVLDLCSNLVLGQQIGSKAISAIESWMDKIAPETAEEITRQLPRLKSGEAYVWTRARPDKPTMEKIPMCRSYHPDRRNPAQAMTNKDQPKTVDASKFVKTLADELPKIVEEKKANDPAELRKTIKTLEAALVQAKKPAPAPAKPEPIFSEKDKEMIENLHASFKAMANTFAEIKAETIDKLMRVESVIESSIFGTVEKLKKFTTQPNLAGNRGDVSLNTPNKNIVRRALPVASRLRSPVSPIQKSMAVDTNGTKLAGIDIKILTVLSNHPEGCTAGKLCLLAGYAWSGSTKNSLARLRTAGAIEGGNGEVMRITEHGQSFGPFEELPTGRALLEYWANHSMFQGIDKKFVEFFIANPQGLTAAHLCEMGNYAWSGSVKNSLSRLRTAGVIEGRNNEVMKLAAHLQEHL